VGTGWWLNHRPVLLYPWDLQPGLGLLQRRGGGDGGDQCGGPAPPARHTHGEFAMGKVMRSDVIKFKSWLSERVACPEASGHFEIWDYQPFCEVRDEWDDFGERKLVWQMKSSDYLCEDEIDPKAKDIARLLKAVKDEFKLVAAKDDEHTFYAARLPR